jgi:hypothetical protein
VSPLWTEEEEEEEEEEEAHLAPRLRHRRDTLVGVCGTPHTHTQKHALAFALARSLCHDGAQKD